jgi:hypothetical protein
MMHVTAVSRQGYVYVDLLAQHTVAPCLIQEPLRYEGEAVLAFCRVLRHRAVTTACAALQLILAAGTGIVNEMDISTPDQSLIRSKLLLMFPAGSNMTGSTSDGVIRNGG